MIANAADFVWAGRLLSLAVTVKLNDPLADGVPEITPVAAVNVNPAGRLPEVIDHVYPGVPPIAVKVCVYAVPAVPAASDDVEMDSVVDATVMDSGTDLVCTGLPLSLIVTVKAYWPLAVGVPEITPLPAAKLSPAGRLPDVIDQK